MATVFHDKITDSRIKALQKAAEGTPKGLYLWDTSLPGWGCKAMPANRKGIQQVSWLVQRFDKEANRLQRAVFGKWPIKDVAKAKAEALKRLRSEEDLVERNRVVRREAKQLLGENVETYLTELPKLKTRTLSARYLLETRQMLERDLVAPLGANTPVAKVTLHQVRGLIKDKQLEGQHAMAKALLSAVRPFFKWCVAEGIITVSPLASYLDAPKPVPNRKRILTPDEIRALWKATEDDYYLNPFYRLLLLTAQRRDEVSALRWSELDLDSGVWTIPADRTKNNEEHKVHLSPLALAELARVPRNGEYLFPSKSIYGRELKRDSFSGFSKAKARLDKLLGFSDWRLHDLRRTAATGMASLEIIPHIIERVLNHVSGTRSGLIGTYQQHPHLEARRIAIEAWSTEIARIVGLAAQSNVVPIRGIAAAK